MAMDTLLVVATVCLVFSIFALVLALTDRSTTRWQRQGQDEDRASTRASFPDKHASIQLSIARRETDVSRRADPCCASNEQDLRTNT